METIDYKNFIDFTPRTNYKKQFKARVIDTESDNKKVLIESIDGSLRMKLNNKTGENLYVGDYVTVEYKTLLTPASGYVAFKNGTARLV